MNRDFANVELIELDVDGWDTETVTAELPDAYAVRKDRPCRWLQRLCVWILRKLGAKAIRKRAETRWITVPIRPLLDAVDRQLRDLFLLNKRPDRIIMGRDAFQELTGDMLRAPHPFLFDAPCQATGGRARIAGVRVQVVPWLRGCVVLPEED